MEGCGRRRDQPKTYSRVGELVAHRSSQRAAGRQAGAEHIIRSRERQEGRQTYVWEAAVA